MADDGAVSSHAIVDALRPIPVADDLTAPFWAAARRGRLAIQRCQRCRTYYHPPIEHCDECESRDLAFEDVSGRGTVYAWTRVHETAEPAFRPAVPFTMAYVELVEQPWLLVTANLAEVDPSTLTPGAPVEVTFIDIGDGVVIPDFRLVDVEGAGARG